MHHAKMPAGHLVLNEIQGKADIPRPLYRRFDPYVFTFNLETETVSTFYFSVVPEISISLLCGVVMTF